MRPTHDAADASVHDPAFAYTSGQEPSAADLAAIDELDRALEALAAANASTAADTTLPVTRSAVLRRVDRAAQAAEPSSVPLSTTLSVETTDLLLLAARLQQELPDDMPEPGFRAELRAQLLRDATGFRIDPNLGSDPFDAAPAALASTLPPATLTLPQSAEPMPQPLTQAPPRRRRFSYFGVVAALAAVMVAAVSVGTFAVWMNDDDGDPPAVVGNTGQPTVGATAEATSEGSGGVAEADTTVATGGGEPTSGSSTQPADAPQPTPEGNPGGADTSDATEVRGEPTPEGARTTPPVATATVQPASTATLISSTPTTPNGQPTVVLLANVPPVDAAHMEQGPIPAADGGGPTPPREDTSVELETAMPTAGTSAPLYRLSPPTIDPDVLVQEVGSALGISGNAAETQGITGDPEWFVSDDSGAHFQWDPDSGAFSFTASSDPEAPTGGMDPEAALAAAQTWLAEIGYPIDGMTLSANPSEIDPTLWMVNLSVDTVPHPGLGHPIGVTAHIDLSGRVVSASGYWLTLTTQEDAPLLTVEDAWTTITDCKGIWTGGGIVGEGGAFTVDAIDVSYLLTTLGDGDLVLQPVYRATGDFETADGSVSRISVFVQAVRGD